MVSNTWAADVLGLPELHFDGTQADGVQHLYDLYVWMSDHSKGKMANRTVQLYHQGKMVREHRVLVR